MSSTEPSPEAAGATEPDPVEQAWQDGRFEELLALTADPAGRDPLTSLRRVRALKLLFRLEESRRELAALVDEPLEERIRAEVLFEQAMVAADPIPPLEEALGLTRALGDPPEFAKVHALLAWVRLNSGDPGRALATLGEPRPDAFWCLLRADIAAALGDRDGARRWYREVLVTGSAGATRWLLSTWTAMAELGLGVLALFGGDLPEARRTFERVLERSAAHPHLQGVRADAYSHLGEALRGAGDLDGAVVAYRAALALREEAPYRINLALVEVDRGHAQEALELLDGLPPLQGAPLALAVNVARATCAAQLGDLAEFDRAVRRPPRPEQVAPDPDIGRLARLAAGRASKHRGWTDREVQARRIALSIWARAGRRAEADTEERALRRLADRGAQPALGPFRLERPLARGAFGEVWAARHVSGVPVAIKVLAAHRMRPGALDRELRAVAALDHPHVVRLLDHGTVDRAAMVMAPNLREGAPWIATELADGTLEPRLGRVGWSEVLRTLVSLLDALAHAHARGLVHLDVKPANVLLSDGRVKLSDFGLASAIGQDGEPAGTPTFMAPEQFLGRDLGPWTDLYAVGCLAAALVVGAPPFARRATMDELRRAHFEEEPQVAPVVPVPAGFGSWLRRALAKRPEDRFVRAADAARALLSLGDPVGPEVAVPEEALAADLPTVVLPREDRDLPAPDGGGDRIPIPPVRVPERWTRPTPPPPPPSLADAGLALFGLRRPPFVGRQGERDRLWAALREVVATSSAAVVVIRGPPGVGRSALAGWLCERAHEVGAADVVAVRATGSDPPGEALRRAIRRALGPGDGVLAAIPTTERGWIEAALAGSDGLGPGERHSLLARALAHLSRRRPVVLWVDGELDRETAAAVGRALRATARVLVILSVGQEVALEGCATVELPPPSDADGRALLDTLLPLAPATAERLALATRGDPRFALQLLTDLVTDERLEPTAEGAALRPSVVLPDSLEALWRSRLRRTTFALDGTGRAALRVAALLGPIVDDRVWEDACGRAEVSWSSEGRDLLLQARLATPVEGGWAFADPALPTALAGGPDPVALHRACAEALRVRGGDPMRIARHEEAAGRIPEAVTATLAAVDQETGTVAELDPLFAGAERLIGRLLPDAADHARLDLLRFRARHLSNRLEHEEARRVQLEAIALALRLGRPEVADQVTVHVATDDRMRGRPGAQVEALERVARTSTSPLARQRALRELGLAALDLGRWEEAERWLREAVDASRLAGVGLPGAVAALGGLRHLQGDPAGALPYLLEARALALGPLDRGMFGIPVANALRALGRLDEAEREYRLVEEAADATGAWIGPMATLGRAITGWLLGDRVRGDRLAEEALARLDPRIAPIRAAAAVARLVLCADGPDDRFERALAEVRERGLPPSVRDDGVPCFELAVARAREAGWTTRAARIAEVARLSTLG